MPLDFKRCWTDPDLELYRDTVSRFIDGEMAPHDAAARERGHVGHAIWRRAGELGLLCADLPERYGGAGGDFRHEAVFIEEMARRALSGMNTAVHGIARALPAEPRQRGAKSRPTCRAWPAANSSARSR